MKFICDKSSLQKEISFASEVISSKSTVSILSNVYLEAKNNAITIRATDVKIGFETSIPAQVDDEGATTVFCDKLSAIIVNLPDGMIEVEQKESKLLIKPQSKKVQFTVKTIEPSQFPQVPDIESSKYFSISNEIIKEMIEQTIFSVSDDETRYFLNGVFFEKDADNLIMVSTDGRRLSYIKKGLINIENFESIIIPPKILYIILKRALNEGEMQMAINAKNLFIKFGQYRLSTVLLEGKFPNYRKVIPDEHKYKAIIKKQELVEALKRVSVFVELKSRRTYFEFSKDKLVISSEDAEIGIAREEIDCQYSGPDSVMAINYKYIDDPLKVIKTPEINFTFTEVGKALMVFPEPPSDYFHVLMPMQSEQ